MSDHDIFAADILEDQLFLLNLLRYSIAKNGGSNNDIFEYFTSNELSRIFLAPSELVKIKSNQLEKLYSMTNLDCLDIVMTMRTLCNCCSLMWQIYNLEEWKRCLENSCKTCAQVDKELGYCLTYKWTTTNIKGISKAIGKVLDFLILFGSLYIIPDGVLCPYFLCHKCRSQNVLSQLSEITHARSTKVESCKHILGKRQSSTLGEKKKESVKNEKEESKDVGIFPLGMKKVSDSAIEEISLGKRIAKNRKVQEMKAMRNILAKVEETFKQSSDKLESLQEDKFISTSVYETMGRIIIFAKHREMCIEKFGNDICFNIHHALELCGISYQLNEEKRGKFLQNLSSVTLEKVSLKMAQETFYRLLLDPITLTDKTNALIRTSILAKTFLLTFGIEADEIAVTSNKLNDITVREVMHSEYKNVEERFLRCVFIIFIYNQWLNVLDIPKEFHLKLHRGDRKIEECGVYFLYEDEKIGLYLSNEKYVTFIYDTVTDLCLLHALYLLEVLPPKFRLELEMSL